MKIELFINEEKKTVVTVLKTKRGIFKGIAKCCPDDVFDEGIGENISDLRANLAYQKKKVRDYKKKVYSLEKQAEHMTKLATFAELDQEEIEDKLEEALLATHGA